VSRKSAKCWKSTFRAEQSNPPNELFSLTFANILCSRNGDRIVLEGEADQIPDVEPGDIIFHLEQTDHEVFQRAGADLAARIEVTLAEALCGFSRVVVKHLDGRGIEITHPKTPGDVLRPDQVLKISGEGMPHKRSETRGDLYLTVEVKFPEDGWALDAAALDKLRAILPGPGPSITAEPVDDVDYDPKANLNEFGARDTHGGTAWVDDDDDDEGNGGPQCTTQ
jgi:DnaJ family protein A protein 2